jgi:hypothetical protein
MPTDNEHFCSKNRPKLAESGKNRCILPRNNYWQQANIYVIYSTYVQYYSLFLKIKKK